MVDADIEEDDFPPAAILLVDDRPANLLALSALLEPLASPLLTAQSGPEALELVTSGELAVVLLDVMMPDMDGFETLARLRAIPAAKHVPVILVTAYELDARAMDRVQGMGTVDYILKPVAPELLRSKVAAFVSLYRRGEELRRRGEALAAKDRHIAMLAHDLQSPLTAVGVSASQLLRAQLDPRLHKSAERVSRGVVRMSEMIRNLTDYARAGRGAIPITRTDMNLADLCREVADDFQVVDAERRIDIGCAGTLDGRWDRNRLYQAIANLVSNALRYGTGDVVLSARGEATEVHVAVHNIGPPIPAELLPLIFQPFERGQADRAGLGLGLYVVREIAKAHGGDISATSSTAGETTFVLRLPRSG
jgi:two-component system, sensor histidine kinase and response regulator